MFLTFGSTQRADGHARNPKHAKRNDRQRSTAQACASCRRRKIKCDGEEPCEACQWYKTPELCVYPERRPSQSHSEKSVTAAPNYRTTLEKLFPSTAPEDLVHLSRDQLLDLVTHASTESQSQDSQHQDMSTVAMAPAMDTHSFTERPGLEALHSMPDQQLEERNSMSTSDSSEHISDDVNALSLLAMRPTSYLGISSIQAALKVIAWLHPEFESDFPLPMPKNNNNNSSLAQPSTSQSFPPTEAQILDAYFINFHPFSPLLDEVEFRRSFATGVRKDSKWLALANIVLALGTLAVDGSSSHAHRTYFERSMSNLNLRSLGNPSLEVIQALALIGGWYCHYVSEPNLGYSLTGAALRMAVTLGLHREPYKHVPGGPSLTTYHEHRRRIWWSLCCLEIWGHETLGRLSIECFGPSTTVNPPHQLQKESYVEILPLSENIRFVKIASKIQDFLAIRPTSAHTDMFDMDSQLLQWWENVPPILKTYEPYPESLYAVRTVMRWRYYNQRILLYRPALLSFAMRQVPFMALRVDECTAIQKCCEIADMSIQDISMTSKLNQVVGWNAVWLLFQATMVPLICLSIGFGGEEGGADYSFASSSLDACRAQVETALATLNRMRPYGHTAGRSYEVVSRLLEATLQSSSPMRHASATTENSQHQHQHQHQERLGSQNNNVLVANVSESYQQMTQGMVLDEPANSFEDYWSNYMWQYLNMPASNEMWPDVPVPVPVPDMSSENEIMSLLGSGGENA